MAYIRHERISATGAVKTVTSLDIPKEATSARLQSDTVDVRYTMDGATDPSATSGMVLVNGLDPEDFLIQDVQKIRFTRGGAQDGGLNVHYYCGREVEP